jgi:hypothetical protein
MQSKWLGKVLSIFVVLTLALSMAPSASALGGNVAVPVNGGWTRGDWTQTYTFTLQKRGELKVATNWAQVCGSPFPITIPVLNFGQPFSTRPANACAPSLRGNDSQGADYFYGNSQYFYFTFSLEPGTYALSWQIGAQGVVGQDVSPQAYDSAAWVRVDVEAGRSPSIALTVVDPPATAWASVQWLDPRTGKWISVDGWSGPLQQDEWGFMVFAVDVPDRGAGPFRWVVYDKDPATGGRPWAMTHVFNLPTSDWSWFEILKGWNLPK